jgi:tRNA pseudouridine55 synthase
MDGFINLFKPRGMTSSDAVVAVRRVLPRGIKVGHGGTLDPDAAGVLPICAGKAARLFDYIIDKQKAYVAELTLGVVTDTQDSGGAILSRSPVSASESDVRLAALRFIGDIEQIPPAFSAIHIDGKRLYDLARAGQAPVLQPRRVRVESIEYIRQTAPDKHMLRVLCGKGVYIRAICHDIGALLGCGGHMSMLTRTAAGIFAIEDSVTLEELKTVAESGGIQSLLYPLDAPLGHMPAI